MKKVYFAQRMDGLSIDEVRANYEKFKAALAAEDVSLINPAEHVFFCTQPATTPKSEVARIVKHDLFLLRQADALLVDYSVEGWNYVGCTCEIAYAHLWGKPIVVFTGGSANAERIWLRHLATRICDTLDDTTLAVLNVLKLRDALNVNGEQKNGLVQK
ncbi:MAG: hypothetical protein ACFFCW_08625 [Candidatus Hodarchaeota archaeon]